mgnify:CR=1 FL=1
MGIDLEQIRAANPIEDIVAQRVALKKSGMRFVGVEHDIAARRFEIAAEDFHER